MGAVKKAMTSFHAKTKRSTQTHMGTDAKPCRQQAPRRPSLASVRSGTGRAARVGAPAAPYAHARVLRLVVRGLAVARDELPDGVAARGGEEARGAVVDGEAHRAKVDGVHAEEVEHLLGALAREIVDLLDVVGRLPHARPAVLVVLERVVEPARWASGTRAAARPVTTGNQPDQSQSYR